MWPIITALVLGACLALHIWWRGKYNRLSQTSRAQIDRLQQEQQQAGHQIQTQQEALFNSMVEGLLLLDEKGRIQLANRAFTTLFGVNTDIRSRTIMEALRLHELADVVETLGTEQQVIEHEFRMSRPNERWLQVNGAAIFNGNRE